MANVEPKMDSVDTNNFSVVRQDGNLAVYQCGYCKEEFKEPGAVSKVRRHIPAKHKVRKGVPEPVVKGVSQKRKPLDEGGLERKKKKEEAPVELTCSQAIALSDPMADPLLQELEAEDTMFSYMTSTQISKEVDDILDHEQDDEKPDENENDESRIDVDETAVEDKMDNEDVVELKQMLQDEQLKVAELKLEAEKKESERKEAEMLAQGTIGSLEEERDRLKARVAKLEPALIKYRNELQNLKSEKANSSEINKVKKELKRSEARCEEMVGQVETLTVDKTKALAEAARMTTMCDSLMELQKSKTGGSKDSKCDEGQKGSKTDEETKTQNKCDRYEHGACTWGAKCRDNHPTRICGNFKNSGKCNRNKCDDLHDRRKEDCWYWMDGRCNKTSLMECKGKHEKEKKGVNNTCKNNQSFLDERQLEDLAERVHRKMDPPLHTRGQESWGARGGVARQLGRGQERVGGQGDLQQEVRRCLAGLLGGQ